MRAWLERQLLRSWYGGAGWTRSLAPLAALFRTVGTRRRAAYLDGRRQAWRAPVPVVVIGNITAGGTGKTPLVIALVQALRDAGWKPAVLSRGYGRRGSGPVMVNADSDPALCGDEPVLIARETGCPVVVNSDRVSGAMFLLGQCPCDVLISDDGLQHYALARDIEVAVVDGDRGLGNGLCLPAGPLREPPERLDSVDYIVQNGGVRVALPQAAWRMRLQPGNARSLADRREQPLARWKGRRVHAVAAIGNPARFFDTLGKAGLQVIPHAFPDHHAFRPDDLAFGDMHPVLMTSKDAVKCRAFERPDLWEVPVSATFESDFLDTLIRRLQALRR